MLGKRKYLVRSFDLGLMLISLLLQVSYHVLPGERLHDETHEVGSGLGAYQSAHLCFPGHIFLILVCRPLKHGPSAMFQAVLDFQAFLPSC